MPPTAWKLALQPSPAALAGLPWKRDRIDAGDGKWAVNSQDEFSLIKCQQLETCLKIILTKELLKIVAIRSRFVNYISYKYISSREHLMGCGHIYIFWPIATPKRSTQC